MSYDYPEFAAGQIGRLRFHHLNAAFRLLERLEPFLPLLESMRQGQTRRTDNKQFFLAEITGFTPIPGASFRWLYSWRRVGTNANDRAFQPKLKPGASGGGGPVIGGDDPPANDTGNEWNSTIGGDPFARCAMNGCEANNTSAFAAGQDLNDPTYVRCGLEPKPIPPIVVPMMHEHGVLGLNQITSGRYPIAYTFAMWNLHGKVQGA